MKYELEIIGCGGHARSVADVLLRDFPDISACFIDNNAMDNEIIIGYSVNAKKPISHGRRKIIPVRKSALVRFVHTTLGLTLLSV